MATLCDQRTKVVISRQCETNKMIKDWGKLFPSRLICNLCNAMRCAPCFYSEERVNDSCTATLCAEIIDLFSSQFHCLQAILSPSKNTQPSELLESKLQTGHISTNTFPSCMLMRNASRMYFCLLLALLLNTRFAYNQNLPCCPINLSKITFASVQTIVLCFLWIAMRPKNNHHNT